MTITNWAQTIYQVAGAPAGLGVAAPRTAALRFLDRAVWSAVIPPPFPENGCPPNDGSVPVHEQERRLSKGLQQVFENYQPLKNASDQRAGRPAHERYSSTLAPLNDGAEM